MIPPIECKVLSVDFEDNTVTLILPKDFLNKYEIKSGTVIVENVSAFIEKGSEAGR